MKPTDKSSRIAIDAAARALAVSAENYKSVEALLEAVYGCGYYDGRLSLIEESISKLDKNLLTIDESSAKM